MDVPWLRSLVAGLSSRRPGFAPWSIHVGFVVDKVALGQVFSEFFGFPLSIYNSIVALQTHIIWGMRNVLTQVGVHSWVWPTPSLEKKGSTDKSPENNTWCRLLSTSRTAWAAPRARRPCQAAGILSLVKCQSPTASINTLRRWSYVHPRLYQQLSQLSSVRHTKSQCHCGDRFSTSRLCQCVVWCHRWSGDWSGYTRKSSYRGVRCSFL
jgi:hypothetical protein